MLKEFLPLHSSRIWGIFSTWRWKVHMTVDHYCKPNDIAWCNECCMWRHHSRSMKGIQHTIQFLPPLYCQIRCEVDENLWPNRQERHDTLWLSFLILDGISISNIFAGTLQYIYCTMYSDVPMFFPLFNLNLHITGKNVSWHYCKYMFSILTKRWLTWC